MSRNSCIYKLEDIVNKYNNTYHSTIKMKPVDVKSSTYINSSKDINKEDSKFRIGDIFRISKCKNIFAKSYVPNLSKEVFVIERVKNTAPWTYVINDVNPEKLLERFTKKDCERQIKKSLEL